SSIIGGTFTMFRASWKLSAVVWPLLVTGALHGARAGAKRSVKSAQSLAAAREEAFLFAEERLQHVDIIRWFCRAEAEAEVFRGKCQASVAIASRSARVRGASHLVLDWAAKSVLLGLASLGSQLVARGELTAAELTSYFFHASFLGLGLYGLVGLMPEVAVARTSAARLAAIVAKKPLKEASANTAFTGKSMSLSFEDVHFRFSEADVLCGFSLQLAAGHVPLLAFQGVASEFLSAVQSRCGAKERRAPNPDVDAEGAPHNDLCLAGMNWVAPQIPALLGANMADAIAHQFGARHRPSAEQIEDGALQVVVAAQWRERSGLRGPKVMTRRWEEVETCCRAPGALIRESPILLLDEPTSGLDATTASALAQAVLSPRPNRPTTLVATHSLALIRSCDTVAVVANGRVVQRGQFSQLIADPAGHLAQIMRQGDHQLHQPQAAFINAVRLAWQVWGA
ncbi:Abcb10, partial [Symbiodinium pilosum]